MQDVHSLYGMECKTFQERISLLKYPSAPTEVKKQTKQNNSMWTHLIAHVEWQGHHAEIVDYKNSFEVKGFAILHDSRPQWCHKVNVCCDDDGLGDRRRHEQPILRPCICKKKHVEGFEKNMQTENQKW